MISLIDTAINRGQEFDIIHPSVTRITFEIYIFMLYKVNLMVTFKIGNILLGLNVKFSYK
jgi:hypothetical protein